jgi:hypothetical protein
LFLKQYFTQGLLELLRQIDQGSGGKRTTPDPRYPLDTHKGSMQKNFEKLKPNRPSGIGRLGDSLGGRNPAKGI